MNWMPLVSVTRNRSIFEVEYSDITDVPNLNSMGNFYRRKSIHSAIVKKLKSCIDTEDLKIGDTIMCDDFEIEFQVLNIDKIK